MKRDWNMQKSETKLGWSFGGNTFGFAIGIDFQESSLIIGPQCSAIVTANRVFNVCVGLTNLPNTDAPDAKNDTYTLFHGDTVVVNESDPARILTATPQYLKLLFDCWWQIMDYLPSKDICAMKTTCKPINLLGYTYIRKKCPGLRNKPLGKFIQYYSRKRFMLEIGRKKR